MIELRGAKVLLRTLEREHCRQLWERYVPVEPLPTEPLNPGLSVEGADQWFEEMQAKQGREHVYLGIFTPDGELLGDVQLSNIDWRFRTAHLGGSIARSEERGQGYGTDAALTLLRYGFDHLDLHRVTAVAAEYNTAAQHALEKLGFQQEGRERQVIYCAARRWDRLIYGLLCHEFKARLESEIGS
jgi:RimJ/RimL family protein N-acetyltransferase